MMKLTTSNYFSIEASKAYWSASQFKEFNKCEAAGLASVLGQYERKETDAILIGKYVDAYFSGESNEFFKKYGDTMYKRDGTLYAKYERCGTIIDTVESQPLMMDYLSGNKQVIMTGEMFGVNWKCKLDVFNGERIVDLKCVKDFSDIYEEGFGRRSWVEYWSYDIQGAIYQRIVEQNTGKSLPFYLVAVTKEPVPDVAILQIPQHILDAALSIVESKIDRFDLVKSGDVEPERCETCDYCKLTKRLIEPKIYELKEV